MLKRILNHTLKPFVSWYIKSSRNYTYKGFHFIILPGVFHPGLFFSSKFLLNYLLKQPIQNKTVLELGSGSGFISIIARRHGAIVTASDISRKAIENSTLNAEQNQEQVTLIHSDLFEQIPLTAFDYIVINPPYYKKSPQTESEHAWYCGENGEYFKRLFENLENYTHKQTKVLMVLSDECDIPTIENYAKKNNFGLKSVFTKRFLWEINSIHQIEIMNL